MTASQKILKRVAIALGVFFAVSIILLIIQGISFLLHIASIIKSEPANSKELTTLVEQEINISSLKINLESSNLQIKPGNLFKIETNNNDVIFENNEISISIKEKNKPFYKKLIKDNVVIVTLPQDNEKLVNVEIENAAGIVDIIDLDIDNLNLENGVGKIVVNNSRINIANVEEGVGQININTSQIENINLELGIGEINYSSNVSNMNLDVGIGSSKINLDEDKLKFNILTEAGIGSILIDGKKIENLENKSDNKISLKNGIGTINLNFKLEN